MKPLTKQKRVRAQLMSDGKRVRWENISFFYLEEIPNGVDMKIKWKYKASLKTIETKWTGKDLKMDEHFRRKNIVRFKENIFINLDRLQIVDETKIYGPQERARVEFYFEDGLKLVEYLDAEKWSWWKTTFM